MSAQPAAVAPLDVARARRLTKQLQQALDVAIDLLGEAFAGRVWEPLGHESWEAYCAAELPQLAILGKGMAKPERVSTVVDLRGRGMSTRAIAAALGLGVATVHRALDDAGVQLATVTSLDGRQRPATAQPAARPRPRVRRTDRLVELLAEAGPAGLTVVDVCKRARWGREIVAPTLTRLEDAGRIRYVHPERRGLFGTYAVTSAGE